MSGKILLNNSAATELHREWEKESITAFENPFFFGIMRFFLRKDSLL